MSRKENRARKRRALEQEKIETQRLDLQTQRCEFQVNRKDPAALAATLKNLAKQEAPIWRIAEPSTGERPLDDEERAMIAQMVAQEVAFLGRWRPKADT